MNGYLPEGIFLGTYKWEEDKKISLLTLERAKEQRKILQAPVILCDGDMNLHVSLGNDIRGIIPKSDAVFPLNGEMIKDIAILTRVGKHVCFHVTDIIKTQGETIALLSRRSAQEECYENKIRQLKSGDIIKAKVTHMENFGAFLDIGCGIISLMSIDCISVSRISHPAIRLSVGEVLDVAVRSIDAEGRVYTSRKELLGTWEENAAFFRAGQTVPGIIRSIESYGIFVELTPNLTGLAELKPNVKANETATVYIKSILPERMKIKLVILDSYGTTNEVLPQAPHFPIASTHIDYWRYSPRGASKVIETRFFE